MTRTGSRVSWKRDVARLPLESSSGRGGDGSCIIAGTSSCCCAHWHTSALEVTARWSSDCVVPPNNASATPLRGEGGSWMLGQVHTKHADTRRDNDWEHLIFFISRSNGEMWRRQQLKSYLKDAIWVCGYSQLSHRFVCKEGFLDFVVVAKCLFGYSCLLGNQLDQCRIIWKPVCGSYSSPSLFESYHRHFFLYQISNYYQMYNCNLQGTTYLERCSFVSPITMSIPILY